MTEFTLSVPCLFGLEGLCAQELRRLDMKEVAAENGRVLFKGTFEDIIRANLWLRTGERVLLRLASFPARTFEELTEVLADWPVCYLDAFTSSRYPQRPRTLLNLLTKQLPSYGASLETAVSDLAHYVSDGFRTVVLVSSEQRALNLQALLREQKMTTAVDFQLHELPGYGKAVIAVGGLTAGMEYPVGRFAVLTEGQSLLGKKRRSKPVTNRQKLGSYADLSPGDLVVHEHHGVGRFLEMTKMTVDGVQKDYVKIAYAGADVLYVPATQLDLVSKYIGGGEDTERTKLNKLGGAEWTRQKAKAKKAAKDMAKGLIQLYAQRQRQPGYAFSPDSPWQKEFEDDFPYNETEDQLRSIAEIKRDMETARPMDRLLCGDVGYGKTEVALRAVMKCVLDGKELTLAKNEGGVTHRHGGNVGFDRKFWDVTPIEGICEDSLILKYTSPDGEEGYPGTLRVMVTYTFTDDNELLIHYEAVSDRDTLCNLTNHSYFNLEGEGAGPVTDHVFEFNCDTFTVVDEKCIPTGEQRDVTGTPFDLRQPTRLADGLAQEETDEQLRFGKGFDHNFNINDPEAGLRFAVHVEAPVSGRTMDVFTDMPAVQFYCGNMLEGVNPGACGRLYHKREGFCLETQYAPDSINHPEFPDSVLRAGEKYDFMTIYTFDAE